MQQDTLSRSTKLLTQGPVRTTSTDNAANSSILDFSEVVRLASTFVVFLAARGRCLDGIADAVTRALGDAPDVLGHDGNAKDGDDGSVLHFDCAVCVEVEFSVCSLREKPCDGIGYENGE